MDFSAIFKVIGVLAPIPVMLLLGWILRFTGVITERFVKEGNKVVYYVCLPALIILKFVSAERGFDFDATFLNLFLCFTVFNFIVASTVFYFFDVAANKKIPFIVGSFRGNLAIFTLAVLETLVSGPALANALIAIGGAMVLYNVLTVSVYPKGGSRTQSFFEFLTNPLILSMVIGAVLVFGNIPIPRVLRSSLNYCAEVTFPLAFIIMGATLRATFRFKKDLWFMVTLKTLVAPMLFTALARRVFGFDGDQLIAFFVLCASPVAAITVAISSVTKSDELFATEAVTLSTALAFIIVSIGISFL